MTIINPTYLHRDNSFQENLALAFSDKIEAIDTLQNLQSRYPNATIHDAGRNSVLYAGFINTHVHLEFSANKTTLQYGSFMPWLDSVIENRNDLIAKCDNQKMMEACQEMMNSGITTFGAVSSFGSELEVCMKTPQKVLFFNELIGSNASTADILYEDFLKRLDASKECGSGVTPAIAIHSPYSVHPIVLKRAVAIAKNEKIALSTHFLESQAEREWLEKGRGEFLGFFQKFFSTSYPVTDIKEFMESFDALPTHFVHAVQATDEEFDYLADKGHSIAHCPRSNRLLGCGRLPIEKLIKRDIPFTIATDGLSSNNSLNIFDELRASLMLHHQGELEKFANLLIKSITSVPAKIFHLNSGEIAVGRDADLALIKLPDEIQKSESIALQTILHTQKVEKLYINGKKVL